MPHDADFKNKRYPKIRMRATRLSNGYLGKKKPGKNGNGQTD
jgi:hypothetical protein